MQFAELIILGLSFLVIWLVTSFILWIVGRIAWGKDVQYTDALLIILIGNIINFILLYFFQYFIEPYLLPLGLIGVILIISIPWLIVLVGYIFLIMKFFDTEILGAIGVGLLVVMISIAIGVIFVAYGLILLALLGLAP
ncbi:MAG: hypothetical protein Q6364_01685 [Candidatus Hermodarchaeota archaeon]|nr:hypothetical protein [Candidatus Hermodarchaeota archaeon]